MVSISLSSESSDFLTLKYYPNPVGSTLYISNDMPIKQIFIYNLNGQLILKKSYNNSQINLDLNHLPRSTYIAKIETDEQSNLFKIIKQ
jgi:hypothetical protein